jgi:hypothetical protein
MPYYHRHRKDDNQGKIEDELRARGMSVRDIHDGDIADLLVGFQGANFLFEVKDPAKPPSARKLSDKQKTDHESWRGQLAVIETAEDALEIIYG